MYLVYVLVAPRDEEELAIWRTFIGKVKVELAIIVRVEMDENIMKRSWIIT